ncbi:hypothetical protein MTP99_002622 [Tenebrio molitor]|nr:hypothetical protein MTP99_002622 [Tenebrio molitor]
MKISTLVLFLLPFSSHEEVFSVRNKFCNDEPRFQSATFRDCVACSGSIYNSPSGQFGMHSPAAGAAEEDRQRESAIAPVHTLLTPGNQDYLTTFYQANV